jgi:hypothetical protein
MKRSIRPTRSFSRKWVLLVMIAIVLGCIQAAELFYAIDRYAVDVPFWDQWDFYQVFFTPHSLWETFSLQFGPHRQGAGGLLTWMTNELTGWNQRAQAFMIGVVMLCAAGAALWLKKRLWGPVQWFDAILVFVILSLKSWEIYFTTPNVSHGALPLLLILLIGVSWTVHSLHLRYGLIIVLNFLALFTGFGMFAAPVTSMLIAFDCRHAFNKKGWRELAVSAVAFCCSIASIACFCHSYTFQPAVDCFHFPDAHWYLYPVFVALEFAAVTLPRYSISIFSITLGFIVTAMFLYMLMSALGRLRRQTENYFRHQVVFFLIAFSFLFAVNVAIGRLCLGLGAAMTSRYRPLLIPAVIGAYYYLASHPQWVRTKLVVVILACIAVNAIVWPWRLKGAEQYQHEKASWVQAYKRTGDAKRADSQCGCHIYPDPDRTRLDSKLHWLRQHKYSLFREESAAP